MVVVDVKLLEFDIIYVKVLKIKKALNPHCIYLNEKVMIQIVIPMELGLQLGQVD